MQILARGLQDKRLQRALIITPRPKLEVLQPLRSALNAAQAADLKVAMDRVDLAQVFDIDGVWEVLADLDRVSSPSPAPQPHQEPPAGAGPEASLEIGDSQDEDDVLSSPKDTTNIAKTNEGLVKGSEDQTRAGPELIIITHFSSLLTSLFTARQRSTAHPLIQHLSSHIRHLTRNLSSSPLVLILNSTTSPSPNEEPANSANAKPLDPTLRSVFNPPIIPGLPSAAARRNKPSFGTVFTQTLDLHLLCTRLPRSRGDADEVHAGGGVGRGKYVTVVEVLLDELGVWDKGGNKGERRFREQRWGPVDVKDGAIVDAFEKAGRREYGEVRLAAGFGGRRV